MIEIIQQTEKTEDNMENKLPKNIRQIGNPEKDFRIYMEDYVYTYLHPAQIYGMETGLYPRMLILLGEIHHFSNRSCAFISGAILVEMNEISSNFPELNEKQWKQIHKEIVQYFEKCEIVGWVLDIPGNTLVVTKEMEEIHRKNFVSPYQFFFLMDSKEREEAFYTWKSGELTKKEGYFIYYEKNPQMQEYMISKRQNSSGETSYIEDVEDTATKNYRAMMLEKKERTYKRRTGFLSYLTSILMVVVLCSVSVLLLEHIHRMDEIEQTITTMSAAMESTEQVKVETIKGTVLPVADTVSAAELPEDTAVSLTEVSEDTQQITENAITQDVEQPVSEASMYREQGYYMVQVGDNLQKICYKIYHTDAMVEAICKANAIEDENTIYVGQKILLP